MSFAEMRKRLVIAELTLGRKDKEITILKEQLQQYEAKWLEYECKMKTMEEMWHNQMTSLQVGHLVVGFYCNLKAIYCTSSLLSYQLECLLILFSQFSIISYSSVYRFPYFKVSNS